MDPVAKKLKANKIALQESDSTCTFWNGVKVWVGNNEYEPPNDGYHFIVDTPEGNKFTFNIRVEDGKPVVEQMWCK